MRISQTLFDQVFRRAEEITAIVEQEHGRHRLHAAARLFVDKVKEESPAVDNGIVVLPNYSALDAAYTLLLADVRQGRALEESVQA